MKDKNVKKNNLIFKKKELTELQKQENLLLNGGQARQDTQYHDYDKFLKIKLPK
ncbi:hypothetical protein [Zobellia barbeyronii]|uniref:Uncharacterized protein n=1 Tax=Zobellia barbeyronii TaxID=2748009 RepID=A0ABS5WBT4_9FLAO|nr:hypothetical protein [Zobellia barbeyronii]MBT2160505.1 hypothetical protein [Zobellia barbeyronii]